MTSGLKTIDHNCHCQAGLGAKAGSRPVDIRSEVNVFKAQCKFTAYFVCLLPRTPQYEKTPNQVTMPKTRGEEKTVRADFVVDDAVVEVRANKLETWLDFNLISFFRVLHEFLK